MSFLFRHQKVNLSDKIRKDLAYAKSFRRRGKVKPFAKMNYVT
ncbi:hypothetical protein EV210_102441 [Anaerospora hongkongensis]|uniref:Uncharacterized protein n=1 Tax=Anaerospora hongkongensis TaxID=244830 RepID=A0A4R1QBF0_9FIRM|nr:hypothetical protein EV210_102441 [Anaerospora hongkongensis]